MRFGLWAPKPQWHGSLVTWLDGQHFRGTSHDLNQTSVNDLVISRLIWGHAMSHGKDFMETNLDKTINCDGVTLVYISYARISIWESLQDDELLWKFVHDICPLCELPIRLAFIHTPVQQCKTWIFPLLCWKLPVNHAIDKPVKLYDTDWLHSFILSFLTKHFMISYRCW